MTDQPSKATPVDWPSTWPDLKDKTTSWRGEDQYSIFLPVSDLARVKSLVGKTVGIDGKKFALSYRMPFPDEDMTKTIPSEEKTPAKQFRRF